MSDASNDTSGVGFPPPLLYAGGFAVGYGAHRLLPIRLWPTPTTLESVLGWGLLVAGVLLAASAAYLFRRAGTTPNPTKPTSARSEEHTSELQSLTNLVCRLLLEKKKKQHK